MPFSHVIEEQLQSDPTALASIFSDMMSVPAFLYNFVDDRYLFVSRSINDLLPVDALNGQGMHRWINRIHPEDFQTFFDAYMKDMDRLAHHCKGDTIFKLSVIPIRIANVNMEWVPTIIKSDVVGYDAQGRANCIFGLLLTEDAIGKADEKLLGKNDWAALRQVREKHYGQKHATEKHGLNITVREWEVLQLLKQGFSTRQISAHLKISMHTVESHRKKLLHKFGAHTSAELIAKAMTHFKWRDHP